MNIRFLLGAVILSLLVLLVGSSSQAVLITTPTGLSPGDQYRLAFVTSGMRNAASSNNADYNDFVTLAANAVPELASLGVTWTAIVSTATVDARVNTSTFPVGSLGDPIYLVDGNLLAANYSDLWDGSIGTALNRTELDTVYTNVVWTGTRIGGTPIPGGAMGESNANVGIASALGEQWVENSLPVQIGNEFPLYALSSSLTVVTVPEPNSLLLLGLGLGAQSVVGRRRARCRFVSPAVPPS